MASSLMQLVAYGAQDVYIVDIMKNKNRNLYNNISIKNKIEFKIFEECNICYEKCYTAKCENCVFLKCENCYKKVNSNKCVHCKNIFFKE